MTPFTLLRERFYLAFIPVQICSHFLWGPQVLGNIIAGRFGLAHVSLLQVESEAQRCLDIGACVRLSPPASKIITVRPRIVKYTR